MRKPTKRARLFARDIDAKRAAGALEKLAVIPTRAEPVTARGWFNRQGELRRLKVTFADGWKATVGANGNVSWGIKLVSEPKGAAA